MPISLAPLCLQKGVGEGRIQRPPAYRLQFLLDIFGSRYGVIGLVALIPLPQSYPVAPAPKPNRLGRGFGHGSVPVGLYGLSYTVACSYLQTTPPLGQSPPLTRRDRYGLARLGVGRHRFMHTQLSGLNLVLIPENLVPVARIHAFSA